MLLLLMIFAFDSATIGGSDSMMSPTLSTSMDTLQSVDSPITMKTVPSSKVVTVVADEKPTSMEIEPVQVSQSTSNTTVAAKTVLSVAPALEQEKIAGSATIPTPTSSQTVAIPLPEEMKALSTTVPTQP